MLKFLGKLVGDWLEKGKGSGIFRQGDESFRVTACLAEVKLRLHHLDSTASFNTSLKQISLTLLL
jgi:hypothetical protein